MNNEQSIIDATLVRRLVATQFPQWKDPWRWSIYRWLEGDTAASAHIADLRDFATSLRPFVDP